MGEPFRHRSRVRFAECDPQGVVFYANYLAYLDVAVTELWRASLGGYEGMIESGLDMVVVRAEIEYLAALRFDEEFDVVVAVEKLGSTSLVTGYRVEHAGEVTTRARLAHVFVSVDGGEKTAIPDSLRAGLERHRAEL